MTKTGVTTAFGEPLSDESKSRVDEIRRTLVQPIHPNFDTDFNVYRFVLAAERQKKSRKDVVEYATKSLDFHLRMRTALNLDEMETVPFDKNPWLSRGIMPRADVQDATDSQNRLLWYIEYASINVESIAHMLPSSECCRYQFWQFEAMLRRVMRQERETGRLSALRHVVDMHGYDMSPFTMLFVSSGTLAYYSQLFHYENYPELVSPVDMVNIARWIHVPYKLARTMMPAGFADRFRLHDSNFLPFLQEQIHLKDIPVSLGGLNQSIHCVPAKKFTEDDYWKPPGDELLSELETLHVGARKMKTLRVDVDEAPVRLHWYYKTDGDIYFGVFRLSEGKTSTGEEAADECSRLPESGEMIYPWLKITAKMVHESSSVLCEKAGRYVLVWCNRHSWLQRRTVDLAVHIATEKSTTTGSSSSSRTRLRVDGTKQANSTLNL